MEQLIDLLELDKMTSDGVIYPTAVVAKAVAAFEERIKKDGGVLGECSPPQNTQYAETPDVRYQSIDTNRVSHIVRHVWIDNKLLKCKVKLLGRYAEILDLMTLSFHGIPRAVGTMEGSDTQKVCTDYTLITVDLSLNDLK